MAGYHDLERGLLLSAAAIRSALQGAQDSRWPLWVRDVMHGGHGADCSDGASWL